MAAVVRLRERVACSRRRARRGLFEAGLLSGDEIELIVAETTHLSAAERTEVDRKLRAVIQRGDRRALLGKLLGKINL